MVRIAYFGTDGRPGHYAIPILLTNLRMLLQNMK